MITLSNRWKALAVIATLVVALFSTVMVKPANAMGFFVGDPGTVSISYGRVVADQWVKPAPNTTIVAWSCTPWIQSLRTVRKQVWVDRLWPLEDRYEWKDVEIWDVLYGYDPPRNHLNDHDGKWRVDKPRLPGKYHRSVMACAARDDRGNRAAATLIGPRRLF